jgi:16S rRNA (adenine1518-N6/adenine1519-N6)-dimethyltransferase
MFQHEFALRLCAPHGTRAYGSLTALAQSRLAITRLFDVPPTAFAPRPSVRSTVVRLEPLAVPLVRPEFFEALKRVLRAAFSGRRKTLENALARGLGTSREAACRLLEQAGIEPTARADSVPPTSFARLAELPGLPDPPRQGDAPA